MSVYSTYTPADLGIAPTDGDMSPGDCASQPIADRRTRAAMQFGAPAGDSTCITPVAARSDSQLEAAVDEGSAEYETVFGCYKWWAVVTPEMSETCEQINKALDELEELIVYTDAIVSAVGDPAATVGLSSTTSTGIDYAATQRQLVTKMSANAAVLFFEAKPNCYERCSNRACACNDRDIQKLDVEELTDHIQHVILSLPPDIDVTAITVVAKYNARLGTHTIWGWPNVGDIPLFRKQLSPDEFNQFAAYWHEHGRVSACTFGL